MLFVQLAERLMKFGIWTVASLVGAVGEALSLGERCSMSWSSLGQQGMESRSVTCCL